MAHRAGITLPQALEYELWELAAAANLDLVETWGERDEREIVAKAESYYEETKEVREAKLSDYAEKRRERELERRRLRREKVT